MAKLTEAEREGFTEIVKEDLRLIRGKIIEQIKTIWDIARQDVLKKKGYDVLLDRQRQLKLEQQRISQELHDIQEKLHEEDLTVQQMVEYGGSPDEYGRVRGANFYGIPVTSQTDYEIAQLIKSKIDTEAPAKFLDDLGRSSLRSIIMSGTFEEARDAYNQFYSFDFRSYGVDIPPKLIELKEKGIEMKDVNKKLLLIDTNKIIDSEKKEIRKLDYKE